MFRILRFKADKEAAYVAQQSKRAAETQRLLMVVAATVYALAGLWLNATLETASKALSIASIALFLGAWVFAGLSFTTFLRSRLDVMPIIVGLMFGWLQMIAFTVIPGADAANVALMFALLAGLTVLMAPTVQSAMSGIVTSALLAALAFGIVFPLQGIPVNFLHSVAYGTPLFLLVIGFATALDYARREAFSYKHELSRRATTDEISGVSNRAHIHQMMQNEFGRARRYKEPLSIVMLEIDNFDGVLESHGPIALDTLIQVFAGYCIVLMRHCDSFGRLNAKRFLAILPETPAKGAKVLAERMCRDLACLNVQVDGEPLNFTVSIGVAEAHQTDTWGGDLLRRCTQALDDAIERGRNTYVLAPTPAQAVANDSAPTAESPMLSQEAMHMAIGQGGGGPQGPSEAQPLQQAG